MTKLASTRQALDKAQNASGSERSAALSSLAAELILDSRHDLL